MNARGAIAAALAGLLVGAASCATLPACPAKGGTRWVELETSHFTLRTNLADAEADELMRTLEETRAALRAAVWPNLPDPAGRTQVVAVDNWMELSAYFPDFVVAWQARRPPFRPLILLGTSWRQKGFDTFAHELAHDLSYRSLPLEPPWYSEGVATFVETLSYDRRSRTVTIGAPAVGRLADLHRSSLPASSLIPTTRVPPGEAGGFFESNCWLLFRYLVDRDQRGLARYQNLIRAMTPSTEAWRSAFPSLAFERVDEELEAYKGSRAFSFFRRPVNVPAFAVARRPLGDASVHAQRAFLLQMRGSTDRRYQETLRAELDEALREDPDNVDALTLAFLRTDDVAEQRRLGLRAIAAHPSAELAAVMYSDTLDAGDPKGRAALVHALVTTPQSAELLLRLARSEAARGDWQAARRFADQALHLGAATNQSLLELFAEALARTGSCGEAAFVMDRVQGRLSGVAGAKANQRGRALVASCRPAPPAESAPAETPP